MPLKFKEDSATMKNSEMKTIIRHIDRLTRNLNARGRHRYADNAFDDAVINARRENDAISKIGNMFVFYSGTNERFAQKRDKRSIEVVKQTAESLLKKECKDVVTHLKALIKYCDIAIKAQEG